VKLVDHSVSCTAVLLALTLLIVPTRASYANVDDRISSTPEPGIIDLNIYTADGKRMIGHARYTRSFAGDSETLRGESDFLDGQQDTEVEVLRYVGRMPVLVTYKHSFFNSDHLLQDSSRQ